MGRSELARTLAEPLRPVALAQDRGLAVLPRLEALLPAGLPRGAVVAVGAPAGVPGATSLALALTAGPSQAGAWVAVVGAPALGLVAAAEHGASLERLVLVDAPPRSAQLASVVAALVDGFELVLVGPQARSRLGRADSRRLVARVREGGAVLLSLGDDLAGRPARVRLRVKAAAWHGIREGSGHLQARRVTVEVSGRGAASRSRRVDLWLPTPPSRGNRSHIPEDEAIHAICGTDCLVGSAQRQRQVGPIASGQ